MICIAKKNLIQIGIKLKAYYCPFLRGFCSNKCVSYLDGLIDGLFNVTTNIVYLIDTSNRFVGIGDVDGWHVKAGAIEARPLAQLLHDLHHYPLPMEKISFLGYF